MEYQEKIKESGLYLQNATDLLKKAGRLNGHYKSQKYVRTACGVAYHGALIAADAYLNKKGQTIQRTKGRKNVDDYRKLLAKLNLRVLNYFNTAYNVLHIIGYYDGELNAKIIKTGFEAVEEINNATEK